MKKKVKVKYLEVGMFINDNWNNIKILAFVPSRFQKNGIERRRARVKSICIAKHLPAYMRKFTHEIGLGKMESTVTVESSSKYLK